MFKKLLSLALAALLLVGVLASCALPNADGSNTTANPNNSQDTTMEETLDIPDTRYDDTELCFLTRDESEWSTIEIFAEEMTSNTDNINNAVYALALTALPRFSSSTPRISYSVSVSTISTPSRRSSRLS